MSGARIKLREWLAAANFSPIIFAIKGKLRLEFGRVLFKFCSIFTNELEEQHKSEENRHFEFSILTEVGLGSELKY